MNKFFDIIKSAVKGQSIYRVLSQQCLKENSPALNGRVIDLAGGSKNNYFKYLNLDKIEYSNADIKNGPGVDVVLDLAKPLPLADNSFDGVLLFNCLYIFEKPEEVLREIRRVLKNNSKLLIISPFVFNEAPEPTDYWRLTSQGLRRVLSESGFNEIRIIPFGERFTAALYLLNKFLVLNFLRPLFYLSAILLDKLVPHSVKKNHPCPFGYLTIVSLSLPSQ